MNAKQEKSTENASIDKKRGKKASTTDLPMVDLDAVLVFLERVEGEGLQTLSQQDVAKRLGYANPTSTPFYRRIVAAKLFGLLDTTQGVNLTRLALDYFKPTDEQSKQQALVTSVRNVIGYQGIIERFSEKRLPPLDILKNSIEREFDLAPDAANACADIFVRSVNRAGLVKSDGTFSLNVSSPSPHSAVSQKGFPQPVTTPPRNTVTALSDEHESHYLTLDASRNRRVTLQAPPIITASELKRIQNWLAVQFHVVEVMNAGQSEQQVSSEADDDRVSES
ncbi:MAG: hypothetical protein ACRD9S_09360 [Pyrinomonadaceae bacterium]